MPLTFVEIERQKNWRIAVFFLVLLSLYFVILTTLSLSLFIIAPPLLFLIKGFLFRYLLIVIAVSLIIASIHFYFSAFGAIRFLKKTWAPLSQTWRMGYISVLKISLMRFM